MTLQHRSTSVQNDDTNVTDDMNAPVKETTTRPVADVMASGRPAAPRSPRAVDRAPAASLGLILGGFVALLLSAWAGIVPFLGPAFGYSADGTSSWTWDRVHILAALVPGAVGLVACLVILTRARHLLERRSDAVLVSFGLILVLSGIWLTVAPVVWPVVVASYFQPATTHMTLAYWLGYSSGPGVLLVAFGGFVMGRSLGGSSRRQMSPRRFDSPDFSNAMS